MARELETAAKQALACLDLTNLNADCTSDDIDALSTRARTEFGPVAAICIWPKFVKQAAKILTGSNIKIATVVNFPSGMESIADVRKAAEKAVKDGADEVDLVIPWPELLEGHAGVIAPTVASVKSAIGEARLKAILETGMLETEDLIIEAARHAIEGGADFIKTSTGKVPVNATPRAVRAMLKVIKEMDPNVGIKPSGGIKTTAEAGDYLELAANIMGADWISPQRFRFGASGVLNDILAVLGGSDAPKHDGGY